MNRAKRKFTVAVATVGFVSVFMAFIGVPLVAALFAPAQIVGEDGNFSQSFQDFARIASIANIASILCLLVAGACFVYVFVMLAIVFIGPKETAGDGNPVT